MTINAFESIKNAFTSLRQRSLNLLLGTDRNYNWECGYPNVVSPEQYREFYDRWGIATRAVQVWPEECWAVVPRILENEDQETSAFEQAVIDLDIKHHIFAYMNKIDVLSGIGRYGVLFMGLNDGRSPDKSVTGKAKKELLYLRVFDEMHASIATSEKRKTNRRFGQPTVYNVAMQGHEHGTLSKINIDWTRTVHIADNTETDSIFGVPRLQPLYNHVHDIRKIGGGGAEMFWKGGFPGLGITIDPNIDLENVRIDKDSMKDEIEKYSEGLKRYLLLTGATANTLNPNIASPKDHFEVMLKLVTIGLGVPQRIFLGSEAAKLASIQDKKTWQTRVAKRQELYLTPFIVRAIIDKFIEYGVLPEPKGNYKVSWPDLEDPSESDKVKTALARTNAIARYIQSGAYHVLSPEKYFRFIHKFNDDEMEAIKEDLENFDPKALDRANRPAGPAPKELSTKEQESTPQEDNNG